LVAHIVFPRQSHWRARAERPLAAAATANRQPLLAVDPEQLFMVQRDTLAPQQNVQPPIAKPPPFTSKPT
jgi:hypothetical protein